MRKEPVLQKTYFLTTQKTLTGRVKIIVFYVSDVTISALIMQLLLVKKSKALISVSDIKDQSKG